MLTRHLETRHSKLELCGSQMPLLSLLWYPYRELTKIRLKTIIVPFEAHSNASPKSFDVYIPCRIRHLHSMIIVQEQKPKKERLR